jgi:long-chain fatty acid transport protein
MKKNLKVVLFLLCFGSAAMFFSTTSALATDGMNLEGYGPIATGMGGASMAYDNGTAGVMNNPATLGLMPEGNRLDVALGYLGPHVSASVPGQEASSSANAFYMPALGWVKKAGPMAYGIALFSQGGMGTEYDKNSFMAAGSGQNVRSELGVGRVLFPVAYEVNKNFIIGGSLDFVWASLDLKMALSGAQFSDMVAGLGGTQTYGAASGSMVNTLVGAFTVPQAMCGGVPCLSSMSWARFDFSDDSPFTGKAKGDGFGGKIGGVYKASDKLALGATYHSKTWLGDLEATGATVSMNVTGPATGGVATTIPVTGKIAVKDFQWPQMIGAGAAYQLSQKTMLVFDYKWINWADVMKSFKMTFTADSTQSDPNATAFSLGGQSLDATLFQKWKDQHVFMLGAAYMLTDVFTVRGGLNITNNPIPNTYLNPLFPAIERNHATLGTGYMLSKASTVDLSYTYAPKVETINGQGVKVSHYQTNAQVMYSYRF